MQRATKTRHFSFVLFQNHVVFVIYLFFLFLIFKSKSILSLILCFQWNEPQLNFCSDPWKRKPTSFLSKYSNAQIYYYLLPFILNQKNMKKSSSNMKKNMTRLTRPSDSTRHSDPNSATLPRRLRTTLRRPRRRSRRWTTPKPSSPSTSTLSSLRNSQRRRSRTSLTTTTTTPRHRRRSRRRRWWCWAGRWGRSHKPTTT